MMNRYDRGIGPAKEARLHYLDSDYHVIQPGSFVRCGVTDQPIPLDELRYWSADLQEAYVSAEVSLQRHRETLAARAAAD